MEIKPIKTNADYRLASKEIETLMSVAEDTPDGEKLDVLVTLVEAYERKNYPLDLPSPVEAIKFEMDRRGPAVKDNKPMDGFATASSRDVQCAGFILAYAVKGSEVYTDGDEQEQSEYT